VEFLDTNVLVYAPATRRRISQRPPSPATCFGAAPRNSAISLQVLQEFYVAARAPRKLALAHEEALKFCGLW